MSVIVRYENRIFLFAKGADTSILNRSSTNLSFKFKNAIDYYYL